MDGQDQAGVVGQAQQLGADGDALAAQALDLVQQGPGVDDHAVADQAALALDDAGREQAELVGLATGDQRVAGVMAALEARDDLGAGA